MRKQEQEKLLSAALATLSQGVTLLQMVSSSTEPNREPNREFVDVWENPVSQHVTGRSVVTINEILRVLGIPRDQRHAGNTRRVAAIMRDLGWAPTRRQVNGVRFRCWVAPNANACFKPAT